MITFKYSLLSKLIYRYGNFPLSVLLLFYLYVSVGEVFVHWYYGFFVLINLAVLILLNGYYFKTYRFFPFTVQIDNEKMICSNFFMSSRKVEIYHCNIGSIYGGLFSGYQAGPIYVSDSKQNITIGFHQQGGKFLTMMKIILQNINAELYNSLAEKIKANSGMKV